MKNLERIKAKKEDRSRESQRKVDSESAAESEEEDSSVRTRET